jgi:acetate kinase
LLGVELYEQSNEEQAAMISGAISRGTIRSIHTVEELMIAGSTPHCWQATMAD